MIIERIHCPGDIKKLTNAQTRQLCDELRAELVRAVAETGGHLASNLGVVELSVAIHRVFDTARDRLIFDVGHQCYVHKMLTGRRDSFATLRQPGGLSGFPKPHESVHDAFVAGHASSAVSVALGMARARTLQKQDYSVLALVGDASLSGGLAFEGMNDAGGSGEPLIVILNDNGMSINENVGALNAHLSRLRMRPGYYEFKKRYRQVLEGSATGEKFYSFSHDVKKSLKKSLLPNSSLFEDMGFDYMGPVDGHDVEAVTDALRRAKDQRCPVLLHVHTKKGKGYFPAETQPEKFHGVGPFDVFTGAAKAPAKCSFSDVFGQTLVELAEEDERVCAVTAAMIDGTGLTDFAKAFPKRLFDVGIAEGHAVSMAGGMAKQGLLPVFAVYSSFLQRGYDMLLQDVSLDRLHVVLGVDRAGIVGADGETHHGCFDVTYLSQIPHMTVLCPASFDELRTMLRRAVFHTPEAVAVRYPRGGEGSYNGCCGEEDFTVLREGSDGTIVSYGVMINQALDAAQKLQERGYHVRVVKINRIAPLESREVCRVLGGTAPLLVLEDCLGVGCVGQRISAILTQGGCAPQKVLLKNFGGSVPPHGSTAQLYEEWELDGDSVAYAMEESLR